ncbi:RskA family anti-sigma factor [Nocardia heshunensis]
MSTVEWRDLGLVELAYPYALDAVSDRERDTIERRRKRADRLTAAAFDDTVDAVRETLAELVAIDACPATAEVEDRLMRALDRVLAPTRDRTGTFARFGRWCAFRRGER